MTVNTPLTATTTTTLTRGTRVRVSTDARWGYANTNHSRVAGQDGIIHSEPDAAGDYSVTTVGGETHWVSAEFLTPLVDEPQPETLNLPSGTRVYVPEGARWSGGRTGQAEGNWCITLNAGAGPDRDGDYLVRVEDQENSGSYVRWQDVRLEWPGTEATPEPEADEADTQEAEAAALREAIAEMQAKWDALGEALNEKAKDQDWCGEYEAVVQPLGFEGRVDDTKCFDVTIEVNYTWEGTLDDTGRDIDTAVSEQVDGTIEDMTLTVKASRSVFLHIDKETVSDHSICCEECLQQHIDSNMIEIALDNEGATYSSIDTWTISSYDECDAC